MKSINLIILLLTFVLVLPLNANIDKSKTSKVILNKKKNTSKSVFLTRFEKKYKNNKDLIKLKKDIMNLSGKAVPILTTVMKNSKYPEKNRWVATFLLGKIMGPKSAPFISKFSQHPSWVMRMASLKTLLALKQKRYGKIYSDLLKDNSFIVRVQALENIRRLQLTEYAPNIWAMLYDKKNYYTPKKKKKLSKRTNIIKDIIQTIGDLKFQKAKDPLLKMVKKDRYKDIFNQIDYALQKITGKRSPKGSLQVKRIFWDRFALGDKTI